MWVIMKSSLRDGLSIIQCLKYVGANTDTGEGIYYSSKTKNKNINTSGSHQIIVI